MSDSFSLLGDDYYRKARTSFALSLPWGRTVRPVTSFTAIVLSDRYFVIVTIVTCLLVKPSNVVEGSEGETRFIACTANINKNGARKSINPLHHHNQNQTHFRHFHCGCSPNYLCYFENSSEYIYIYIYVCMYMYSMSFKPSIVL